MNRDALKLMVSEHFVFILTNEAFTKSDFCLLFTL